MLPSPDILNDFADGKFVLSNLAAKRAKQLREGAPPLVSIESNHPLTIALAEIAAGKIKPVLPTGADASELLEGMERGLGTEEPLPAELGMLLPALDETEVALVGSVASSSEDHDDHDADLDGDPDADGDSDGDADSSLSLSDLEVGDEEEEASPAIAEDETLSLSDIAEQETGEEEETEE